jgi:hypothetical protein
MVDAGLLAADHDRHLAVDHDVDEIAGRRLRRARGGEPHTREVPHQLNPGFVHAEAL